MRPSNQKSRSRGRGRKPQNPMSRNFESNGPDVKIRGNAGHIAEKYSTLARDALSNGDRVIAENYLQHAEHYNRIVAAAQQQSDARAAEIAEKRQADQEESGEDASDNNNNENDAVEAKSNGKDESSQENQQEESAPKERKNSRTRRPRKQPVAENSNDEKPASAKSDETTIDPEVISEDAAKLPDSLLGGMVAEEG
jgi:hypothetical protein